MASRHSLLSILRRKPLTTNASQYHAFSANMGNVESLALPLIKDIFDAPAKLKRTHGDRSLLQREASAPRTPTKFPASSSLPAPLLFEGPAHPRPSFSSLLPKPPRRAIKASRTAVTKRSNTTPSRKHGSIPLSIDNAPVYTYDGPSNMTRYRYSGQKKKNDDGRKPLIALMSLATLAAGATVCLDL
ncbi:hypothetical protein C8R42DRAFT_645191 [Lentinula raphanica]|nr:hypothetical protein C8R42DRAFT_645191 [Lentinula raphanica]